MIETSDSIPEKRFSSGDTVQIIVAFPPGHRRIPDYIKGKIGVIERYCGAFKNPEELAYGFDGEPTRLCYGRPGHCHKAKAVRRFGITSTADPASL